MHIIIYEGKLPHLNSKLQVEYSNALNIAGNIHPLKFYCIKIRFKSKYQKEFCFNLKLILLRVQKFNSSDA